MARKPRLLWRRVGSCTLAGALVAGSLLGASEQAALAAPSAAELNPTSAPSLRDWRTADESVETDPATIVRQGFKEQRKRPTAAVRVVAVYEGARKPVVEVEVARGVAAATDVVAEAQQDRRLLSVELDEPMKLLDSQVQLTTNDPYAGQLWGIDRLNSQAAWSLPGVNYGSGVKVAVVDTGVAAHPDLATVIAGFDATGAGGNGRNDGHGHGTHVAGTVAAAANNGIGVAGVAPGASIMPVKVLSDSGSGYTSDVAEGIVWSADHGANIISMSLGGSHSSALQTAITYAISKNSVPIAAAGNSRGSGSPTSYPAAYPGVLAVAATQPNDTYASFSNAGPYVDISAPGTGTLSTYINNGYVSMSGTSMATPHVSGAAALVLAKKKSVASNAALDVLLTGTADDLGLTGRDDDYGYGMVDPIGAIGQLSTPEAPPPAPTNVNVSAVSSTSATLTWAASGNPLQFLASTSPVGGSCTAAGNLRQCTLTGLNPSTTYTARVVARSLGGDSNAGMSPPFTTAGRSDLGGDTFDAATQISTTAPVEDSIDISTDQDYFKFVIPGSGLVDIRLNNLPRDYDLWLFNASGNQLASSYYGGTSEDRITQALSAGTYVALVAPYVGSGPELYRLSVQFTADSPEPAPDPTPDPTPSPDPTQPAPTPLPPIPVQQLQRRIKVGRLATLPARSLGAAVRWTSTNPRVCSIRQPNRVFAVRVGRCLVVGRVTLNRDGTRSTVVRFRALITVVR